VVTGLMYCQTALPLLFFGKIPAGPLQKTRYHWTIVVRQKYFEHTSYLILIVIPLML
jgi:hypothetical protein